MAGRRFWQIFPLVLIAFVGIPRRADACCGGRDPEWEAERSNEVFRGRLRGYSEAPQNRVLRLVPGAVRSAIPRRVWETVHDELAPKCRLELEVTRVFKGPLTPTRTVSVGGDCDWFPTLGEDWIVFGTREGRQLDVGLCTASGPIRDPLDIEFLGAGRPPDPLVTRWQPVALLVAIFAAASGFCFWSWRRRKRGTVYALVAVEGSCDEGPSTP